MDSSGLRWGQPGPGLGGGGLGLGEAGLNGTLGWRRGGTRAGEDGTLWPVSEFWGLQSGCFPVTH